jgi:hypothetical protein
MHVKVYILATASLVYIIFVQQLQMNVLVDIAHLHLTLSTIRIREGKL